MSRTSIVSMLTAYANVPSTWGRNHDSDEIESAISYLEELIIELEFLDKSPTNAQLERISDKVEKVEGR